MITKHFGLFSYSIAEVWDEKLHFQLAAAHWITAGLFYLSNNRLGVATAAPAICLQTNGVYKPLMHT